ncbi:MAG: YidC/Oxa1 family membrane protein insertase [Lachnospiraceae bacterium]|nr:YidC/Oxa1 family membrane protein insertase [Lachnospiraceae bacterium]
MFDTFYNVMIRPVEYLIEIIFTIMYSLLGHEGYTLIGMSIAVSTLVLPLYARAEAIQEEEREKQKSMERWMAHIKKTFTGDERYMMQTAYFAETGYKPLYALKGTLSLLLQIPFFMAAYHFLSHLQILSGASFGPIRDLAAEDGLIRIGSAQINLLPILMTAINGVSSAIYTKGFTWKQKLQPYVLAAVFLVLLYRSPSGLVLYWTMNNIYSLCKNIVMKYVKDTKRLVAMLSAGITAAYGIFLLASGKLSAVLGRKDFEALVLYGIGVLILCAAFLVWVLRRIFGKQGMATDTADKNAENAPDYVFVMELALTVLLGLWLPMTLIGDAPQDFYVTDRTISPIHYAFTTVCVFAGTFLFWGNIIYGMLQKPKRRIYGGILFLMNLIFLTDALCYKAEIGSISTMLAFDVIPHYEKLQRWGNLGILLLLVVIGSLLWKKAGKLCGNLMLVVVFALLVMSGQKIVTTRQTLETLREQDNGAQEAPAITLSKSGKNVVVIMLDRAIGAYFPYFVAEMPQLAQQFDGFTYYPNTVSGGLATNTGAPELYGGYEYTPEAINQRDREPLVKKFNEAIRVMPTLFGEHGYRVTVCDLPYAGSVETPLLKATDVFADAPYVKELTMEGVLEAGVDRDSYRITRERNFFFYSWYKVTPPAWQDDVYDSGAYLRGDRLYTTGNPLFNQAYTVLQNLGAYTQAEAEGDTFLLMCNNTTHEPTILPLPDYNPERRTDNSGYDLTADKICNGRVLHFDQNNAEYSVGHYHANMAAMLALGRWFDQLREWGVYDNTRIILVGDHGKALGQFDDMLFANGIDAEHANPLLLVKDFGSTGLVTENAFMTNADTPSLAMQGLIADPVNPFTGSRITSESKRDGFTVLWMDDWAVYDGNVYGSADAVWYRVKDDIMDAENWEEIR